MVKKSIKKNLIYYEEMVIHIEGVKLQCYNFTKIPSALGMCGMNGMRREVYMKKFLRHKGRARQNQNPYEDYLFEWEAEEETVYEAVDDTEEAGYEEEYPEDVVYEADDYAGAAVYEAGDTVGEAVYEAGDATEEAGYEEEYPEDVVYEADDYAGAAVYEAGDATEETGYEEEYSEEAIYEVVDYAEEASYESGDETEAAGYEEEYPEDVVYETDDYAEEVVNEAGDDVAEVVYEADDYIEEAVYEEDTDTEYDSFTQGDDPADAEALDLWSDSYGDKGSKVSWWSRFLELAVMDRVILCTGMIALVLVIVVGVIYAAGRNTATQVADFSGVGTLLDNIEMIGEKGLLAVADAQRAKQQAAEALREQQKQEELEKEENKDKEYHENDYDKTVSVSLNMNSVQKDLKLKFTNKATGKLLSNAPFSVTVTKPDNQTEIWSDEDMDGIIYKKGITPGRYKVMVNKFTEERYKDYLLPVGKQLVEVKEEITYNKVDVSDEVKKETEIDAKVEDTKKNETVVESELQDTVAWVESTATVNTYTEISKARIPDPVTLGVNSKSFILSAYSSSITPASQVLTVGDSFTVTAKAVDDVAGDVRFSSVVWSSKNPDVATVTGDGESAVVTAVGEGITLISYEACVTQVSGNTPDVLTGSCSVTVNKAGGVVSVEQKKLTVAKDAEIPVTITVSGFTPGRDMLYKVASANEAVASATIDDKGTVTILGVAKGETVITVTVNYKDGQEKTAATAQLAVKVTDKKVITLDLPQVTAFVDVPVMVKAQIANAVTEQPVVAISSDTAIATVKVENRTVIITGVAPGSATVTVSFLEGGELVKTNCVVTVKKHPREDKESKLKDEKDNQLYVVENNTYREAVYADYYTADTFFIKGETKYTGWQTIDGKVYYFTAAGEKVTGEQVIQGAKYSFGSDGAMINNSGVMGIDVSKWNGNIDWNAVKNSGVSYAIIRCGYRGSSQGMLVEDPKFTANIKGATEAGLKVGVYFFTQAIDEVEAVYEASFVLDRIKNYNISYPVFLDVEASGGRGDKIDKETRTAVCKAFCQTIQNAGYSAGIYANKTWLEKKMNVNELGDYKIWLAQYAAEPTYTGRYDLWQYTSTGKVSGVSGNVDLNLSYLP